MRFVPEVVFLLLAVVAGASRLTAQEAQPLFDGKTLAGWKGDERIWSVRDGCIVGSSATTSVAANTFLVWQGEDVADFELSFEVRLEGNNNSGVQYRAMTVAGREYALHGYQCDVHGDPSYFGMLYEEGGRGILAQHGQQVACASDGSLRVLRQIAKPQQVDLAKWHRMRIVARGNRVQHEVDGVLAVEFVDDSPKASRKGRIGLQLHSGSPMTVSYRELRLKRLATEEVAVQPVPPGPVPQWIWDGKARDDHETWFRRTFRMADVPAAAQLTASCDNNVSVFLNGTEVLKSSTWEAPRVVDVTKHMAVGMNALAVYGANDGGPAGLVLRLRWRMANGAIGAIVTDGSWRTLGDEPAGWESIAFDDSAWKPAVVLGPLGGEGLPWSSRLGADSLTDSLVPPGPQRASPASELRLAPGLTAERLLMVPRNLGSWVSLCMDDRGRLYASDQGRGLYRITIEEDAGEGAVSRIDRIDVDLRGCQGLCWHMGALYAVQSGGKSGLYRLRDTDGDDKLDQVELLRELKGDGEHGPHAVVVAPDGRNLLVLCGNHVQLPQLDASRMPRNWGEDGILPKSEDPNGHAVGIKAPGGYVCLVDPDGKRWELLCAGFRNAYDLAVLPNGDVVTYDADMEWDMGLPWYRPTRICQVLSGADYGWRSGSGKWPADYPDAPPAVCDIGPGSPTGMVAIGNDALALDWTFGTTWRLAFDRSTAALTARVSEFAWGQPFPVTDAVQHGEHLYVLTGGRGTPSSLYRIHGHMTPGVDAIQSSSRARDQRLVLEAFHGRVDGAAIEAALPHLDSADAALRHAARIALESQPVAQWRDAVLGLRAGDSARGALEGALALARQGDPSDLAPLVQFLGSVDAAGLDVVGRLAWLRAHELALLRLGKPDAGVRMALLQRLEPMLPSGNLRVDRELCALLAHLGSPVVVERGLALLAPMVPSPVPEWGDLIERNDRYGSAIRAMLDNMPPADQFGIAWALRTVPHGWTLEQRVAYFDFIAAARQRKGGHSYGGYLTRMVDAVWDACSEAERNVLAQAAGKARTEPVAFVATPPKGPGRSWELDEAVSLARNGMKERDFAAGRNLFHASSCAACHRFAGEGGNVGPDLSSLGNKFSAGDVLEATLDPSRVISDQYAGSIVRTKDGNSHFGRVVPVFVDGKLVAHEVWPAVAEPKPIRVPADEVAAVEPSKISPMPRGLVDRLSPDELLDLLAYTLSRGDPKDPMFRKAVAPSAPAGSVPPAGK